jgi:hypothetical protein
MEIQNNPRFLQLQEVAVLHGNTLYLNDQGCVVYSRGHEFSRQITEFRCVKNQEDVSELLVLLGRLVNDPRTHTK